MNKTKYTLEIITGILTDAGCEVRQSGVRLYVNKTPNGSKGQYGYCVDGDDVREVTENITKRNGEISAILRGER